MGKLATERRPGVAKWRGAASEGSENAKKMLNSGNELKDSLKIKDLAHFKTQNELLLEHKKRLSRRKTGQKSQTKRPRGHFLISDFYILLSGAYLFPVKAS